MKLCAERGRALVAAAVGVGRACFVRQRYNRRGGRYSSKKKYKYYYCFHVEPDSGETRRRPGANIVAG